MYCLVSVLGDHGATILNLREQLHGWMENCHECAVLAPVIRLMRDNSGVKALRWVHPVVNAYLMSCPSRVGDLY